MLHCTDEKKPTGDSNHPAGCTDTAKFTAMARLLALRDTINTAVLRAWCASPSGWGRGTIRAKPKGPVLVTPKSEAVASPTEERGFFTSEFSGQLHVCSRPIMVSGAGSAYPQGRRQGFGLVTTSRAHQCCPSQALAGFLVTPEGAKTMTATTTASRSARTPTSISGTAHTTDSTSEAQAFALLQTASDATMAKMYLSKGNIAGARRKAVQLLKALQVLEVQA